MLPSERAALIALMILPASSFVMLRTGLQEQAGGGTGTGDQVVRGFATNEGASRRGLGKVETTDSFVFLAGFGVAMMLRSQPQVKSGHVLATHKSCIC